VDSIGSFYATHPTLVKTLGAAALAVCVEPHATLGLSVVGAAVANAVYNACGKRVHELPITLDKLL
jgi:hypothetical protein